VLLQYSTAATIFHRRVRYLALSLRYHCNQSLGIILIPYATFVPNFVSFAASISKLAMEKNRILNQRINHSPGLFDARGTEALTPRKNYFSDIKHAMLKNIHEMQ